MPRAIGRYQIDSLLARGGMGSVYRARIQGAAGFERHVALKVLHPHLASDPRIAEAFVVEGKIAGQIHHANVVSTLDVVSEAGNVLLVLEYVDGCSLATIVADAQQRGHRIPIEVGLRIVVDTLHGLAAAHDVVGDDGRALDVVHRDVSPHNILVGRDGVARITDFGVAKARLLASATAEGVVKGRLAYMPPEQMAGTAVDPRADVYATGVVLWELLAGRRLFGDASEGLIVAAVQAGVRARPSEYVPTIPPEIEAVVMQALAREVDDRPRSAMAFADALEHAAAQCGVSLARRRDVTELVDQVSPRGTSPAPGAPDTTLAATIDHAARSVVAQGSLAVAVDTRPRSRFRSLMVVGVVALAGILAAVAFSTMTSRSASSGEMGSPKIDALTSAASERTASRPESMPSPEVTDAPSRPSGTTGSAAPIAAPSTGTGRPKADVRPSVSVPVQRRHGGEYAPPEP